MLECLDHRHSYYMPMVKTKYADSCFSVLINLLVLLCSVASGRLMMPKSILAEDAKKKINATQTITLKWKELQLGTWRSQPCQDNTVHISGSRIKFKAKSEYQREYTRHL